MSISLNTLLDSGSSHCFIDFNTVYLHSLPLRSIPPIPLRLFDGTSNSKITFAIDLSVSFPCGKELTIPFYVTNLAPPATAVLGFDFLTRHNPLVDWALGTVTFPAPVPPPQDPPPPPSPLGSAPPSISLIGAAAFLRAASLPGSRQFRIHLRSSDTSDTPSPAPPDLSTVPPEYHEYSSVFSEVTASTLPPHRPYDLKIELEEGQSPPPGPIYSLSLAELQALCKFLDENLRHGFIRQSASPHGAPVLFVKKKDGSLRLCVDFRALNRITKKDRYPLPLISDLLHSPASARIYTKIDLKHAYHLVRVSSGDEWKTTFRTRYGSFEWLVMPEGLTNAPAAFQRFMNDIFQDLLDVCVIVYLDDILVYSDDVSEHRKHVKEVLRRLQKHGLCARPDKCTFHTDTVEYLGFVLSPKGLTMSEDKIKIILDWPAPRKVKDVQSFLGFANFYRRFIPHYSDISVPLTRLTRKGTVWNWTDECQEAFDMLKRAFTSAPALVHFVPGAPIIVETDASDYALGAILSIVSGDGEVHPVAFHSRTFSAPELNYDVHDKELLAIFEAFRVWRHYLEGSAAPVDVVTDHKNLEYFSTTKLLTRRQARWSEFLSAFNLIIRFRPGRLGTKPDALTRRWDVYLKEGGSGYAAVNPHNFKPIFTSEQLSASLRATYLFDPILRSVSTIDVEQLHRDILAALPTDPVASDQLARTPMNPRWTKDSDGFLRLDDRIYIPSSDDLRLRILRYKHDHILSGHYGYNKTLELIRREYTWPGIRDFVKDYCGSCTVCKRSKTPRHKPYGTLQQLPIPEKPWNSISMDFIEQLPSSSGYTSILVVVDRLTKQAVFIPTVDTIDAPELARLFILHIFSKHGVPSHVTSDRGSEFVSRFFRSLAKALDIELHFTSGYHPEADGQTERTNQTLEQYLRMYCNYQQDNWSDLLPLAEFAFNNSPSATTGISPFYANKGYHPNISVNSAQDFASARARDFAVNLDELHSELKQQIAISQKRYQGPADARRKPPPDFQVGQQVFVKAQFFRTTRPSRKLAEKYLGPFEIINKVGPQSFALRLPDSMKSVHPVYHVSMLEPFIPSSIPHRTQSPPPPVEVDGEIEYEIAEVLDSKIDKRRRNCQLLYLVRWAGYEGTDEETSWILATELEHAPEALAEFHYAYPSKPGPLSSL